MIRRKSGQILCYQKMFFAFLSTIIIMVFVYHNMLTLQFRRIISQRMYVYGYVHNLHGNDLLPNLTYGFDDVLHEPYADTKAKVEALYMVILISSSPHNEEHRELRNTIRQSWGNCSEVTKYHSEYSSVVKSKVKCILLFYMGLSENDKMNELNSLELNEHKDIIIGNFIDSYSNMTRKILFAFNYVSIHYNSKYILKADDDVYINVPKLIYNINTKYKAIHNLYGGNIHYASVVRDARHRHYLTREEFPDDWYPPYNKGSQLIISSHLLKPLLLMSTRIQRFGIDDAYIGLIMNHINVLPTKIKEFTQNQWITYFVYWISSCELRQMIGIGDSLSPAQLRYIHNMVHHYTVWFCVRIDYVLYYAIFLSVLIVVVLLCCRKRYCPWLTCTIIAHSLRIFYNKIKCLR